MKNKLLQLLIMLSKFYISGILVQCFFLNLLLASDGNAQNRLSVKDIYMDIKVVERPVEEIFQYIEKQTGLSFFYDEKLVDTKKTVTLNKKSSSVADLLLEISRQANLQFKQINEVINVNTIPRKINEKDRLEIIIQTRTISGRVVSGTDQEPLPGVNVLEKGTGKGAVTDITGRYSLDVAEGASLVFSFIGYITEEIAAGNRSVIDVTLMPDIKTLDEIVVVGYGTQRRADITGSIASVKGNELQKINTANAMDALQGRVSGVMVEVNGAPGSSPVINIRGIGTTNNSSPLFVVDGMLLSDITFINNNDIESIEVLKDASATAIYGSRGANGVIIITTKKGQEGKMTVNLKATRGIQFRNSPFQVCEASDYAQLLNEALVNSGSPKKFENPQELGKGTNWLDEVFRTAAVQDYQVSVNGGNNKVRYNLSLGNFLQEGIVNKNSYERTTIRLNNDYSLSDKLTVGHNLSGSFSNTLNEHTGVITAAYRSSPAIPVRDAQGNFSSPPNASSSNPVATLEYLDTKRLGERVVGNSYMNWELLNGLRFKSNLGIDLNNLRNRSYSPKYFISDYQKNLENSLNKSWIRHFTWLWENTMSWDKTIQNIHRLNVVGGITAQNYDRETLGASGANFFSDDPNYVYVDQSAADRKTGVNNAESESMMSYLFRVNYGLMDRYLLTASFRADGSSKFGPDSRWGYFPSAAVGWRISEEQFIRDNASWIDNIKVRASWGQIGNDKIANYQYAGVANMATSFDAVFNGVYYPGGTITSLYNRSIHWEASEQRNLGIDLGLFRNRFTLELDYYIRDTKEMLVTVNVPAQVGLTAVDANVGEVRNEGFDFTVGWNQSVNDFKYNVRFIGTTIKNRVTKLDKDINKGDVGSGILITMTREGYPIGSFYGYQVIGIFQSQEDIDYYNTLPTTAGQKYQNFSGPALAPGDLIYADLNGDGMVRAAHDRDIIGNPTPNFIGGLNVGMEWKGFDFSFDFQGNFGNDIFNSKIFERYGGDDNYSVAFLDRWTPDNPDAKLPRMTTGGNNYQISTRWLQDGTYVKLQNVELGYTFPKLLLGRLKLQGIRMSISGNNLFYITEYDGLTPEITRTNNLERGIDRAIYPITSSARLGLNVTF